MSTNLSRDTLSREIGRTPRDGQTAPTGALSTLAPGARGVPPQSTLYYYTIVSITIDTIIHITILIITCQGRSAAVHPLLRDDAGVELEARAWYGRLSHRDPGFSGFDSRPGLANEG